MRSSILICFLLICSSLINTALPQRVYDELEPKDEWLTDPWRCLYDYEAINQPGMSMGDSAGIMKAYRKCIDGLNKRIHQGEITAGKEWLECVDAPDSIRFIQPSGRELAALEDIACYSGLPFEQYFIHKNYAAFYIVNEEEVLSLIDWFDKNYKSIRLSEFLACVRSAHRDWGLAMYFEFLMMLNSENEEMCRVWQDSIDSIVKPYKDTLPNSSISYLLKRF